MLNHPFAESWILANIYLNKRRRLSKARSKQRQVQVKEIKFRPGTEKGDYDIKLKKLIAFLEMGDRTKITLSDIEAVKWRTRNSA